MGKQKIVLKVTMTCKTSFMLRAVGKLEGIDEMTVDMEKGTLTVIGIVDPVCIVRVLKKIKVAVSIESINPEKKKEEPKTCKPCPLPCCCGKCQPPCRSVPCCCGKCQPPCPPPCRSVPCRCGKCQPPCPPPCRSVPCRCGKCQPPCPPPCRSVPCRCGRCSPPCPPPCRSVPCRCGRCSPPCPPCPPPSCRSVPCRCGTCPPPFPLPCGLVPCRCGMCLSGYHSMGCEDPSWCTIV
ncbi:keratin-associated protein 9-1-like [Phoenix dactylifera]|uniref:Keratin-associated protein 9-1-like n=1 Tax=Phoenix dactylifera TaxID=42345 RepID=A0A8B9B1Y0_PHODC|nr:keratin-associated protein 9-1-like [Phoenix dactylifera]